jgi:hypothetical protein
MAPRLSASRMNRAFASTWKEERRVRRETVADPCGRQHVSRRRIGGFHRDTAASPLQPSAPPRGEMGVRALGKCSSRTPWDRRSAADASGALSPPVPPVARSCERARWSGPAGSSRPARRSGGRMDPHEVEQPPDRAGRQRSRPAGGRHHAGGFVSCRGVVGPPVAVAGPLVARLIGHVRVPAAR